MKSELIKADYEKLKGGVRDEGTISFETTPKPSTIPNNHIIIASNAQFATAHGYPEVTHTICRLP